MSRMNAGGDVCTSILGQRDARQQPIDSQRLDVENARLQGGRLQRIAVPDHLRPRHRRQQDVAPRPQLYLCRFTVQRPAYPAAYPSP